MERQTLKLIINDQLTDFLTLPPSSIARDYPFYEQKGDQKEAVVVLGVRRSGKSFFLKLTADRVKGRANICYLDLDDPRLISFTADDFQTAVELWQEMSNYDSKRPSWIFLDEPQNVTGWEKWVTYLAKQKNQYVMLTGSNSNMLSSELATFLTGRHKEINFYPLSFAELVNVRHPELMGKELSSAKRALLFKLLESYVNFSGFPRPQLDADSKLLQQYFKDIVYKDVAARRKGLQAQLLIQMGTELMTNNTRLINKSRLAKEYGLQQPKSVTAYLELFKQCFLIYELRSFSPSLRKQNRSLPKFYAVDAALARHVGFRVLEDLGSSMENVVFIELLRRGFEVFYWSSKDKFEVDFIARRQGESPLAIQVCYDLSNPNVQEREIRALESAYQELGIKDLLLLTPTVPLNIKSPSKRVKITSLFSWLLER